MQSHENHDRNSRKQNVVVRIFSLVILSAFLVILSESEESLFALEIENLK
jgi:hypothetical protein